MARLRILLAEDHETVREGLRLIIGAQDDMEIVGEVGDGRAAIEQTKKLLPDIVVMDVSMPQINGLKATQKLRETCPNVKVLALTRHKDDGYLQQIVRAGASGYVLKQSPSAELLHAIRAIAAGGKYLDPAVAGKVMGTYADQQETARGPVANVSDRESEVLRLIAWGYSNKEIAARLGLSVKTVEVHKAHAMKKLGMQSRIDIVRYSVLQGWMEET
ncbi:MAG TPA: response regulator transcription factor [Pyrinomonadaceae bacterium]|nr:response regulator transcription factor [Pyrinomonadaceae bacterium]